jgi:glycosyltransferase involved in cell wall biosynthesis
MRIAVNTRLLLQGKLEGIGWFSKETLSRIVKNHPEHEFIFFFDRPYSEEFVFAPNVTPVVVPPQARHPFLYITWTEVSIPRMLRKYKADVYFSPEGLGSLRTKVPTCITIHDLAFLHYPAFIDKLHRWHYHRYQPKFAHKAKQIIAVSEFTKKDIVDKYQINPDKISVVYNGAQSAYKPLGYEEKKAIKEQYTDGKEYFIFTSAIHPRKNVVNLLKAFVQFKRRQKCGMKLMIVGRMAWDTDEIEKAKRLMPFKEDVIWTGYLDVKELAKVTAAAYAMVYPSLFEGFGIPIVEAMQCGVPVITSTTSSMPEVGGAAALLADPEKPEDIAEKMGMVYKDERLRAQLSVAAQAQAQQFSWDKSAEALWEVIVKCKNA